MPMKRELSFGTLMEAAFAHDDEGTAEISKQGVVRVMERLEAVYPGALPSHRMATQALAILSQKGYQQETTLLATSLGCDEVNRDMEDELRTVFGSNYAMGGLAGFPFAGVAGFGGMIHHIPQGGNAVVVYGPHVGVDWDGTIGKVNRRGHHGSGACCAPANAALAYVKEVKAGKRTEVSCPTDIIESQQTWLYKELLPYGDRVLGADEPEVELPLALYDCQDAIMKRIIDRCCGEIAGDGKIALLGGVTINTPEGTSEYFLPKKFHLVNKKGEVVDDMLSELLEAECPKLDGKTYDVVSSKAYRTM